MDKVVYSCAKRLAANSKIAGAADHAIRDFLAGKSDGENLLHALYDHVVDEPVPERLRAALRA